jgi:hypothetical protein
MGFRKGGFVRSSIRTIRTKSGTKTISVKGSYRSGCVTNQRRRK